MAAACSFGRDQAALLVEAQRRGRDAAAPRDLADGEQGDDAERKSPLALDFKFT
jgi:hypothetical protein